MNLEWRRSMQYITIAVVLLLMSVFAITYARFRAEISGAREKDALHNKVIHSIQKSDFVYWCFTKVFGSLFLKLIGVPREVYKGFTLEQKQLAQELLNVMHPMSQRRRGSIYEFSTALSRLFINVFADFRYKINRNQGEHGNADY